MKKFVNEREPILVLVQNLNHATSNFFCMFCAYYLLYIFGLNKSSNKNNQLQIKITFVLFLLESKIFRSSNNSSNLR